MVLSFGNDMFLRYLPAENAFSNAESPVTVSSIGSWTVVSDEQFSNAFKHAEAPVTSFNTGKLTDVRDVLE